MGTGLEVTSVTQILVLTPVKYYGSKLGNGFTHGLFSRSVTTSAGQWSGVVMSRSHRGQYGSQLPRPPLWSGGGRSRGGCWSRGCCWSVWVIDRYDRGSPLVASEAIGRRGWVAMSCGVGGAMGRHLESGGRAG